MLRHAKTATTADIKIFYRRRMCSVRALFARGWAWFESQAVLEQNDMTLHKVEERQSSMFAFIHCCV